MAAVPFLSATMVTIGFVTISLVKWGSCTQRFASGMQPAILEEGETTE
jgi:hypothetical protein